MTRPRLWPRRSSEAGDVAASPAAATDGQAPLVLVDGRLAKRRRPRPPTCLPQPRHSLDRTAGPHTPT